MNSRTSDFWFPVKAYGWGWRRPVKWQGWVVLVAYFLLLVGGIRFFVGTADLLGLVIYLALLTGCLITICIWKGERPLRWRWGAK